MAVFGGSLREPAGARDAPRRSHAQDLRRNGWQCEIAQTSRRNLTNFLKTLSGTLPKSGSRPTGRSGENPSVSPVLPLILLETLRDRDRPDEVLEDEDITLSLPRRLGLSEVVRLQIARLEEEVRHGRPQVASAVVDLFRLVLRRPDAADLFVEAGRRVALHFWEQRPTGARRVVKLLPRPLALVSAQRAGTRMFRSLVGPTRVRISRRPVSLRIERSLSAQADPDGSACGLYSGAFEELLHVYTGRSYRILHPLCSSRDPDRGCEWYVEVAS